MRAVVASSEHVDSLRTQLFTVGERRELAVEMSMTIMVVKSIEIPSVTSCASSMRFRVQRSAEAVDAVVTHETGGVVTGNAPGVYWAGSMRSRNPSGRAALVFSAATYR